MTRHPRVAALLVALAVVLSSARAQDDPAPEQMKLDLTGDTVTIVKGFPVTVTAPTGMNGYTWLYPSSFKATRRRNVLTIKDAPKGTHTVHVTATKVDFKKETYTEYEGELVINVGDAPTPPGPKPPEPPDPPKPPDPPPVPKGDIRVLIVYESADLTKWPEKRLQVLYGKRVRDWLRANTDKTGPEGRGWNMWDKDVPTDDMGQFWRDAMKRPRPTTPYMHVFVGDVPVWEGELPQDMDAMVKKLDEFKAAKAIIDRYRSGLRRSSTGKVVED